MPRPTNHYEWHPAALRAHEKALLTGAPCPRLVLVQVVTKEQASKLSDQDRPM